MKQISVKQMEKLKEKIDQSVKAQCAHNSPSPETKRNFDMIKGEISEIKAEVKNIKEYLKERSGTAKGWIRDNALQLILILAAILGMYYGIKTDIKLIKQDVKNLEENHLRHVIALIETNMEKNNEQDKIITQMLIQIERIATIISGQ